MNASEYQVEANKTAIYPTHMGIEYCALGLVGEAGEVAGKIKKRLRDGNSWTPAEWEANRGAILDEIGDVLWYCSQLASEFNGDLGAIMERNLQKLADRQERNVLGGSGDNR